MATYVRTCVHFLSNLDVFHNIDVVIVVFIVVVDVFHNLQTAVAGLPTGYASTASPNDSSSYCAETVPRTRLTLLTLQCFPQYSKQLGLFHSLHSL